MMTKRLTHTFVVGLRYGSDPEEIADPAAPGLLLRLRPTGTKSWLFRYRWGNRRSRLSLGNFPTVSLQDARAEASECRRLIERNIDPKAGRRTNGRLARKVAAGPVKKVVHESDQIHVGHPENAEAALPRPADGDERSITFLAYEYVERFVRLNREDVEPVLRILRKDVLPYWGERDARTITAREVLERLDAIVSRGAPVMANRTADILSQMFKFGIHRDIVEDSPVKLLFKPGGKEKPKQRILDDEELKAFLQYPDAIRTNKYRSVLRILLYTTVRRRALAHAQWVEFNFPEKRWRIPAKNSKTRKSYFVPLTDTVINELIALKQLSGESRFVLPSNKDPETPINPKQITRSVSRNLKRFSKYGIEKFTPNDLRRTARTLLSALGVQRNIAERVLNHVKEKIEGTYDLWEFYDEKRDALTRLEQRLNTLRATPRTNPTLLHSPTYAAPTLDKVVAENAT